MRGLPVRNMNFTFEGIATPLLVHTVQGVQDGGSIAMVNGDVLNEIALRRAHMRNATATTLAPS